jgi:2,5-diketo-D-gluconate reductase A
MTNPTLRLNADVQLPIIGFGTYLIRNEDAPAAVSEALRAGYRHIDTAEGYRNEAGVGAAIRDSGLRRSEVFVTTKLWPGNPARRQTPKDTTTTITSLEASLNRLGLEYVDLYLIHAPYAPEQRLAQWRGLVELKRRGLTRAIGVSNFAAAHIDQLVAAGLPSPEANQIELHPWSQKPQLVGYLRDKGIAAIAYSSLVPLSSWRAVPGQASAKTEEMKAAGERPDSPFKRMAGEHGVSEAQILLRWAVQKGYAVLPKSTDPQRIRQNLDLLSFELTASEMAEIESMDRGGGVAWAAGDPTLAE